MKFSKPELAHHWIRVIRSYGLALEAWSHAEKEFEPAPLVAQLRKWLDREQVKVDDLLKYMATLGADTVVEIEAGDKGAIIPGGVSPTFRLVEVTGPAIIIARKMKKAKKR